MSRPASEPRLYLLAGTLDGGVGPPCMGWTRLYTPSPGRGLTLVREVLPAATTVYDLQAGLMGTRSADGDVFLLSPSLLTKWITVLHATEPRRVDAFPFKLPVPGTHILLPSLLMAAKLGPLGPVLLDAVPVGNGEDWVVTMLGDGQPNQPRIRGGEWDDYRDLRSSGVADAPCAGLDAPFGAEIYGDHLSLPHFAVLTGRDQVSLAPAPPDLPAAKRGTPTRLGATALVLGATARFFLYSLLPQSKRGPLGETIGVPGPTLVYVYDRSKHKLTTLSLPTPADSPACRLFGDWVATPVSVAAANNTYHPGSENEYHPGSENEGGWVSLGHPDVRKIYEDYASYFYLPGELQLNNLADGRELSIRTGQEDSEVLDVSAKGDVVYRVNDQIYLARIEGNAIGIPRLVAKGDDVPEVHWLLWSSRPSRAMERKRNEVKPARR